MQLFWHAITNINALPFGMLCDGLGSDKLHAHIDACTLTAYMSEFQASALQKQNFHSEKAFEFIKATIHFSN